MVRNTIIAGIRTGVQRLVVWGLALLGLWLTNHGLEIVIDPGPWLIPIDAVIMGLVTSGLNALEKRFPVLTTIMSLGQAGSPPKYEVPPVDPNPQEVV